MRFFLISFFLLGVLGCSAQGTVRGKVLSEGGEPLVFANVVFPELSRAVVSDEDGIFLMSDVAVGSTTLEVTYLGYNSISKEITVSEGKITSVEVVLQASEATLSTLEVKASAVSVEEITSMPMQTLKAARVNITGARATTPVSYSNVSKPYLEKLNTGQDLPYMLRFTPSLVTTSDAGNGIGYTSMRIRGSDQSRINVTINGVPLNDAESQNVFWVDLPDLGSSVQSIQIQRGVGTSTNGSGAFGASVRLNTMGMPSKGGVVLRNGFGSFNSLRNTVEVNSGLLKNRFAFQGRVSQILSDGFIDRASSELRSYFLSGAYYGNRTTVRALVFGGHERTYQSWNGTPESRILGDEEAMLIHASNNGLTTSQTDNLINAGRTYNFYEYENQVDDYAQDHYQLHLNHRLSDALELQLAAHYTYGRGFFEQYKEDDDFENYGLFPYSIGGETIETSDVIRRRWLENDFYGGTGSLTFNRGPVNVILGGAYHVYDGIHFGELIWMENPNGTEHGDVYYRNDGLKNDGNAFLQATVRVLPKLSVFADAQYRGVSYATEGIDSDRRLINTGDTLNFFNPKFGLYYNLTSRDEVYASYAVGNREPNRADFIDAPNGSFPSHETLQDIEIGYKRRHHKYFFGVNIYNMAYENQLVLTGQLNDVGNPVRQNVEASYRRGVEGELAWRIIPGLTWLANVSVSENKIDSFDELIYDYTDGFDIDTIAHSNTDISFSPNLIASSLLNMNVYQGSNSSMEFGIQTKYVGQQFLDNTSNADRAIDDYLVNDLRLTYKWRGSLVEELEIGAIIYNILDLEYESNGYTYSYRYGDLVTENFFYPQAGRHFMVNVNARF